VDKATGTLANNLSDAGRTELAESDLIVSGDNSSYSGAFSIADASRMAVALAKNLGTAVINNAGTLVLNSDMDWSLDNKIDGAGSVIKQGVGQLTLPSLKEGDPCFAEPNLSRVKRFRIYRLSTS